MAFLSLLIKNIILLIKCTYTRVKTEYGRVVEKEKAKVFTHSTALAVERCTNYCYRFGFLKGRFELHFELEGRN